jgi:two-component system cell cycle response regulator DivK
MGGTILVVDNDEKNRKLLRVVLQYSGYEVIEAENGEHGVQLAKLHIPALILMDIQMPVMDGIEAMKILKSDMSTSGIPVIALSSYAMKGDRERFINEGFGSYISRPINIDETLEIVGKYMKN